MSRHSGSSVYRLRPNHGIAFLDIEISVSQLSRVKSCFVEEQLVSPTGEQRTVLLPVGDENMLDEGGAWHPETFKPLGADDAIWLSGHQGIQPLMGRWLPLPYLRMMTGLDQEAGILRRSAVDQGPYNWVRVFISPPARPVHETSTLKAAIAIDTQLAGGSRLDQRRYNAPSLDDVRLGSKFALTDDINHLSAFLAEARIDAWLREALGAGDATTGAAAPARFELEHVARYLFLLKVLCEACPAPILRFSGQARERVPVEASENELILDLSDDIGLAVLVGHGSSPDWAHDVARSRVLPLRDLGLPTKVHAVADWIELSEGADPRARERMENCLAIMIRDPSAGDGTVVAEDFDRRRFTSDLLGENNRWAQEWTPGRSFSQVHFVPGFANPAVVNVVRNTNFRRSASQAGAIDMGEAVFPARAPVALPPSLATTILLEIAANSSQVIRVRQIRRQLASIQRAMQARIFRYHRSNNPAQFTDWRRQIDNVATKRLEACAEARQLGNMLSVLMLSEADFLMLLSGLKGGTVACREIDEYSLDISVGRAALPEPQICAEASVGAWLKLMHEAAGSRQLCCQLDIAQPVFQHIVDAIIIGAQRAHLVGELTARFQRAVAAGNPLGDLARCYAAIASRTLGGFLENLSVSKSQQPADASRLHQEGRTRTPPGYGDDAGPLASGARPRTVTGMQRQGAPSGVAPIGQWPRFFRRMVDDNIVAAEGLTAHSEADHELGEHLSMLTSNPLEVEL